MAYDFRANQIRLNRIISSGSIPIYVYSSGSAADFQGGINFPTASIGSDVFLFVSGSSTAKTLFGGDVVISGSVSGSTGGFTYLSGSVAVLGSTDATGLTISLRGLRVTGSYMQGNYHTVTSPDGNNCFVAGQSNTVNAGSAFVHGYGNTSLANYSHAEGNGGNTINALAVGSHAEGQSNTIHGECAHAEGQGTTVGYSGVDVFGDFSHTEGNGTQTYGIYSHAEGYQTTAGATTAYSWGYASHAEGANTIALGRGSHAEGRGSIAYGACTHAGGLYTIASGSVSPIANFSSVDFTQTAYGKYNKRDNTTSLFVVGDGTGDSDALRHDILRVESGSVQVTGSLIATGITGSISGTVGGLPFLVAGSNVTASYNGSGQWTISANASGGATVPGGLDQQIQFNSGSTFSGSSNLTYNYTTNTLTLTGSLTASAVVAGGVNITPVTASLFVYGDGTNRGSGSISGLFESGSLMTLGTIGKFDVEILAMSYGSGTGASWKYTATALWPSSGTFSFLATTELAAEYGPASGSYNPAAEWDVNFNSLGEIELTGSTPAFPSGGTSFYVQVTKKMVATYGAIIA